MKHRISFALRALAILALSGCATLNSAQRASIPAGASYVAMGGSFSAGAGIGPIKPNTPTRCQRTPINYPTLLAQRLGLELTDVSCGGATTEHVLGPRDAAGVQIPAQIDAVTADARLVTITIGGNDLGYIMGLIGGSCRAGAPFRPEPCFVNKPPSAEAYEHVEANMREIARQVKVRAPHSTLVFVQFVTLVPPAPCDAAILTEEDAAISREMGLRIAAMTARVASETNAKLLPMDILSRDHTACSDQPWNSGMYKGYDLSQGSPWHPNPAGMRAVADALEPLLAQ